MIQFDEESKWRWGYCEEHGYDKIQYLLEGYCPCNFNCFEGTEFKKPFTLVKDGYCKYEIHKNQKKCTECWNREIESEYDAYLRLKEKYKKGENND